MCRRVGLAARRPSLARNAAARQSLAANSEPLARYDSEMRRKALVIIGIIAALVFVRNIYLIFMVAPDEASQGMVYRILYFHVPSWWTAFLAVAGSLVTSVLFLVNRKLSYDAASVALTEVGLVFLTIGLVTGSIWGRYTWGIWWTWDTRLTSALVCVLLYAGYLILRSAVDEPITRARIAAVYSIFAFADIPIVWFSIRLFRTQHPQPMELPPGMMRIFLWNWVGFLLLAAVLVLVRLDQEHALRQVDAARRSAQLLEVS
jgi:heme exporter protein C